MLHLSACLHAQEAIRGFSDLSHSNLEKGPVGLNGEWEFYWDKLLAPSDFPYRQQPVFIHVPGSWHRSGQYPVLGYATYRLKIKLPPHETSLSVYFPIVNSACKVWINDVLVAESGVVSTDRKIFSPKLTSTLVTIPPNEGDEVWLTMQVANYIYTSAGFGETPQIDRTASLYFRMNRVNGIENFFAGSLIAMFIYQLILYFLYQRGKPYLWLALICFGVALRSMITHGGSFLLPNLYPDVPLDFWKKIEFGSVYAIVALFPLYVYHLFQESAPRWPVLIFSGISIALCTVVVVTPQYIYGKLLEIAHLGLVLSFVYAVYSISKAWRAGNRDARIILFGVLVSFPFILTEILQNSVYFPFNFELMYLVEIGVLVFLIFQVYLLANHYAKSYTHLEEMNLNLEKIVAERSGQLITANAVKDRLLSVMSHDIKSPLNSLRGVLQLYNHKAISQDEFINFTRMIENDLNKTNILVENILYWTASQLKGIEVNEEVFDLSQLISENINLFQTVASGKKIVIEQSTAPGLSIHSDRNILNLVLRNLISNAIKFSFEGGRIDVLAKRINSATLVQVKDEGTGMDEETLDTLLADELSLSSVAGTRNEKGTGLGLALCREYLEKAGGQLTVESVKGQGSTFNILIPSN
jgi:signal transduction histidine kinase